MIWIPIVGYILITIFLTGWFHANIPNEPGGRFSVKIKAGETYTGEYRKDEYYASVYWTHTQEYWDWSKQWAEKKDEGTKKAIFWPICLVYLPFLFVFNLGKFSSKRINTRLDKQREEANRLRKIMEDNEKVLAQMRLEAEKELTLELEA